MSDRDTTYEVEAHGERARVLAPLAALALGGILFQMFRPKRRKAAAGTHITRASAERLVLGRRSLERGHEVHDVRGRTVVYIAIGLAIGATLAFSSAAILLRIYQLNSPPAVGIPALQPATAPGALFPAPRLLDPGPTGSNGLPSGEAPNPNGGSGAGAVQPTTIPNGDGAGGVAGDGGTGVGGEQQAPAGAEVNGLPVQNSPATGADQARSR